VEIAGGDGVNGTDRSERAGFRAAQGNAQGGIELTRVDGGKCSLYSIDLAEFPNGQKNSDGAVIARPGPFSIVFTGILANGRNHHRDGCCATISFAAQVFVPEGISQLSFSWTQGPGGISPGLAAHQFSNIYADANGRGQR
jgi:hypothetical protein